MQLNKLSLVILVLLVDIVTFCHGDRNNGVGVIGNLPDTFIRRLTVQHSIPVALMRFNSLDFTIVEPAIRFVHVRFRHKLPVFIVEASSKIEFLSTLRKYSAVIWSNHMASFFIVDFSPGCRKHAGFLHIAWRQDILNAKVVCCSKDEKTVVITCNPFTNKAPVPWYGLNVFSAEARQRNIYRPFATFFREYRGNKAICLNLDFDKSKDLGGHEIFISSYNTAFSNTDLQTYKDAYNVFLIDRGTWSTIAHILNGTPKETHYQSVRLKDVFIPAYPMLEGIWNFDPITYPHNMGGFVLASQFRGHKSQLNKILTVVDVNSRIGIGIVYLITFIFLKFFVRQTLVEAILNLVRITCDTGFTNLSVNNATRIFLTGLLFFVVTMQGIYQGNLASLLTTIIPLQEIETMQDVVDFGCEIYGNELFLPMVDHPVLRERYIKVGIGNCTTHAASDPLAVCLLRASGQTFDRVRKLGLHLSSKLVAERYQGYRIRWNCPFEHQFNIMIQRLVEADAFQPWNITCAPTEITEFQFDEEVKKNVVFKNIELGELGFAFVILGIGLVCAIITFIAEVAIY